MSSEALTEGRQGKGFVVILTVIQGRLSLLSALILIDGKWGLICRYGAPAVKWSAKRLWSAGGDEVSQEVVRGPDVSQEVWRGPDVS